ncbi:MAG: hypothetical protein ABI967_08735, partial [bacterium]
SVVRELYRVHNNGRGGVFEAKGKKYIYKFFDQTLADLIWKDITETPEGDVGNLDFDPLYNAQDMKITNFQIGKPVVQGDQATVVVSFRNFGQPNRIKFEMHNGKGGWKIKNVLYGEKSDLITILSPLTVTPAQVPDPESKQATMDSVIQFLLTVAATDFHSNVRSDSLRVRDVRIGHVMTQSGAEQYLLCGQFLPGQKAGKAEWTPFATIKTSGYEQWNGAQAASFCQSSSVIWDKAGNLTSSLQSRLDSLP